MRFCKIIFLLIFGAMLSGDFQTAAAQNRTALSERQIRAKIDVERFSGSILAALDGQPIVSKSYGLANVELDVPNTPQTVFRLASITKQFTAAGEMMLQKREKLNTGDSICRYFTDCPIVWQPITIRHLLTLTHGIAGASLAGIGALRGLTVPHEQWLEATKKKPLAFAPGDTFRYNNFGYTLLGFIIERVSGKSYGEFLQENIFTPLGMTRTGYENPTRIIKNRATGYRQLPGDPVTNVPSSEIFALYARGGAYSTTEDLLLWDKALYTDKILSQKSRDEMFTPFKEMLPGKSYAAGWWTSRKHGRTKIAHGGNLAGFITYFARFPAERVTVIVLSNNGLCSSGKISSVLSAIVFGAPYQIPKERVAVAVASYVLDKYVGEYRVQLPPTNYTITKENGKLMVLESGYPKAEMFAESETIFFLKTEDIESIFVKDARGAVTGVIAKQGDGTLFEVLKGKKTK